MLLRCSLALDTVQPLFTSFALFAVYFIIFFSLSSHYTSTFLPTPSISISSSSGVVALHLVMEGKVSAAHKRASSKCNYPSAYWVLSDKLSPGSQRSSSKNPKQAITLASQHSHRVSTRLLRPDETEWFRKLWRGYKSVEQFAVATQLTGCSKTFFERIMARPASAFTHRLLEIACFNFQSARGMLQDQDFCYIPDINSIGNEDDADFVVMLYVHCFEIAPIPTSNHSPVLGPIIMDAFSKYKPPVENVGPAVVTAFHHKPSHRRDVVGPIRKQIFGLYKEFNSLCYLAPYTSLVGPSRIGISFLVQQLAREGNYVGYISLAKPKSRSYPHRSVIAADIDGLQHQIRATTFFECLIAAILVNV